MDRRAEIATGKLVTIAIILVVIFIVIGSIGGTFWPTVMSWIRDRTGGYIVNDSDKLVNMSKWTPDQIAQITGCAPDTIIARLSPQQRGDAASMNQRTIEFYNSVDRTYSASKPEIYANTGTAWDMPIYLADGITQMSDSRIGTIKSGLVQIDASARVNAKYPVDLLNKLNLKILITGINGMYICNVPGVTAPRVAISSSAIVKAKALLQGYDSMVEIRDSDELKVLVSAKNPSCSGSETNPVMVRFFANDNIRLDLIWDARKMAAVVRKSGTNNFYDENFFRKTSREDVQKALSFTLTKTDYDKFLEILLGTDKTSGILSSLSLDQFTGRISAWLSYYYDSRTFWQKFQNKNIVMQIYDGANSQNTMSQADIMNKITKNRPTYLANWVDPGNCIKAQQFSCDVFEKKGDCLLHDAVNYCFSDATEFKCGDTCLCPENYKVGYSVYMAIGNQKWQFKVTNVDPTGFSKRLVEENGKPVLTNGEFKPLE